LQVPALDISLFTPYCYQTFKKSRGFIVTRATSDSAHKPDNQMRELFGALAGKHQSRIRRYVRSLGVASSSVDDIAQEALLVAYNRFDDYEPGTSFPAWVNTIARNLVWNDRRKASRRYKILNERIADYMETLEPQEEDGHAPEEDYEHRLALSECMELIPGENRSLVKTRYEEGLEPTQMAELFGMSPDSIRQRLMRVRKALRKCIAEKLKEMAE
jgi:RNA polymerase sigma-70 factor (ECF subfamily)